MSYVLVGTEVSYYTGKVRSYLRYKHIPHTELLSSADVYRSVIMTKTGVQYIPVLLTPDGETAVQDSTDIIDFLEARFPANPVYPSSPCQRLVALLFEVYGDEWLLLPAMHYRWSFPENLDFLHREFGRTLAPSAGPDQQCEIGKRASAKFSGFLPALGITEAMKVAIEEWFEEFLTHLDRHFTRYPFLLGGKPSIGDFGLMGPLYAHLSRDPYPSKVLRSKAPHVIQWVERMHFNKGSANCSKDYLPNDEVPNTLIPILQRMFDEHFPIYLNTVAKLQSTLQDATGQEIPRTIGVHEFIIGKARGQRRIYPYTLYMFQRPLDYYSSLSKNDMQKFQERVLSMITEGMETWRTSLQAASECRVRRENNRLILARMTRPAHNTRSARL